MLSKKFRPLAVLLPLTILVIAGIPACKQLADNNAENMKIKTSESERLNNWFEARFQENLVRSPLTSTYLGEKMNQDKLDDVSRLTRDETAALGSAWLDELRQSFSKDRLDESAKLSFDLYEYAAEDEIASHRFEDGNYVFQHMSGPHNDLPSFMINFHQVKSKKDAENYIARLEAFDTYLGQYADQADAQSRSGVLLPRFVYPKLRSAAQNVVSGKPFTLDGDSPLWTDITQKIDALDIDKAAAEDLKDKARAALLSSVRPAYENLIDLFSRHEVIADVDDGVWKLPNGEAFYQSRLNHYTTTRLTADEIHKMGLEEVARIQAEMQTIMDKVDFKGSIKSFFDYLREDPKFTFENNDQGRQAYIDQATEMIDGMETRLDDLFITKPKADMIVKRVEAFREATAFGAFYNQPAIDGSRPGTYYINLKDMSELPIYQMQALAYHEGIPGHHMQIAIGMELADLPKFRTLGGHTAYIEGWALYAESLPGELGLYTDPYQDFGRLSMEIFRAARLVVDTGIHSKKWTRDQAVAYMMQNTANSEGDIRAEVDRYIVWPGQATAYKVGMMKIQALRTMAEEKLGPKFDIREFHDVVLANGSVPLTVLENLVQTWVDNKLSAD